MSKKIKAMESYYEKYNQVVENLEHKISMNGYAVGYVNQQANQFIEDYTSDSIQDDMVKNGERFDLFNEIHHSLSEIFAERKVSLIQMFLINDKLNELKQKINVTHRRAVPYI